VKPELITQKYSRALLEVAEEQGALKEVASGLERIELTFKKMPELAEFLTSPQIDWKIKLELSQILAQGLSALIINFIHLVMKNERQEILPYVPTEFRSILEERQKRARAVVTSVVPLTDDIKKQLTEKLKQKFQQEIILENKTDPEIIGGLKIQLGYTVIDATIQRKLEALGQILTKA
jgi:F-type H+-transporting ATPase subunit delta